MFLIFSKLPFLIPKVVTVRLTMMVHAVCIDLTTALLNHMIFKVRGMALWSEESHQNSERCNNSEKRLYNNFEEGRRNEKNETERSEKTST